MSIISERASGIESEYDPIEDAWDDWSEEASEPIKCLFCEDIHESASLSFAHCVSQHGFDFIQLRKKYKWDFYQSIRTINYIRHCVIEDPALSNTESYELTPEIITTYMQDDKYLTPAMDEDALLYAFENLDVNDNMSMRSGMTAGSRRNGHHMLSEGNILDRLYAAEAKLAAKERELHTVNVQFDEYRKAVKSQFYDVLDESASSGVATSDNDHLVSLSPSGEMSDGYFNSYAHIEIHDQMLKDRIRTEAYRDFIYENKPIFKDKIVLDVGCGTGILSMFAARAGAAQVYAVDNSDIIEQAKLIAAENQLDTKIQFIRGKIEEIELPVPVVDIIISEWMGYFLLFEAMLDSVLVARDKYLAPDGLLAPSSSSLHLIGIEDDHMMNDKVDFWADVYGFTMNTIKKSMYVEAIVDTVPESTRITDMTCLQTFDHSRVNPVDLDFNTTFSLVANRDATLHALLGYFDIDFSTTEEEPGNRVVFTTGPHGVETHWKQTAFLLLEPIPVVTGDRITGEFTCRKSEQNPRELEIVITYEKISAINAEHNVSLRSQTFQLR